MFSFIKGLLWDNIGTTIMALILAIISWLFIYSAHTERAVIDVPLIIETGAGVISQTEKDGEPIEEIKVEVEYPRGPRSVLDNLVCRHKIRTTKEQIDKPQIVVVELTPADFNTKPGVTIKKILSDNKIRTILMQEDAKYLDLKTNGVIQGAPQKGYRVTGVKSIPSKIWVIGPKNILDKYNEISVATKIDITNSNRAFSLPAQIVDKLENAPIRSNTPFVIEVTIEEELVQVVLTVKINILLPSDFPPCQIQIKPREKTLKFIGTGSKIRELKPHMINLFVDVGELLPTGSVITPPMTFAPNLQFCFTPDAPQGIELAEPLDQIKLEILPLPQPQVTPQEPKTD
ncbi:MAG: CdaR family protein [Planctomycetota bacterium]|nr:CdaR family protein [Planctomycetota bacterium]MDI6787033.1 CdaR family protein [Planctomycetota bacterium]